jgi:hypothetical protein
MSALRYRFDRTVGKRYANHGGVIASQFKEAARLAQKDNEKKGKYWRDVIQVLEWLEILSRVLHSYATSLLFAAYASAALQMQFRSNRRAGKCSAHRLAHRFIQRAVFNGAGEFKIRRRRVEREYSVFSADELVGGKP